MRRSSCRSRRRPKSAFDEADLSPMAKSFYAESKRVSNRRIKEELGYRLLYPTYREGLAALLTTLDQVIRSQVLSGALRSPGYRDRATIDDRRP